MRPFSGGQRIFQLVPPTSNAPSDKLANRVPLMLVRVKFRSVSAAFDADMPRRLLGSGGLARGRPGARRANTSPLPGAPISAPETAASWSGANGGSGGAPKLAGLELAECGDMPRSRATPVRSWPQPLARVFRTLHRWARKRTPIPLHGHCTFSDAERPD